jgi:hypothetical protein
MKQTKRIRLYRSTHTTRSYTSRPARHSTGQVKRCCAHLFKSSQEGMFDGSRKAAFVLLY